MRVSSLVLISILSASLGWPQAGSSQVTAGKTTAQPKSQSKEAAQVEPRQAKPWTKIPIPKLPEFSPQEPKRIQLANGMVIFLQEDHELPLISGTARIRGGSREEPAAKVGMIDIYGEVWRTGGTKKTTGDELDDFLEARAAKIETDGGSDSTLISFSCLKQDLNDVWPRFLELLREPAFREEKIAIAKDAMDTVISRRNDNPGSIASREAAKIAYGADSPYARTPEYATVAAVTQGDLAQWHDRYVHPNNIIVGISGDFDSADMERRLREAFETWQRGPQPQTPKIEFREPEPRVFLAEKTDVNQSLINLITIGIRRDNPDYFAVTALNEVLSGGFASRLFSTIRSQLGLAYSVGGGIGSAWDHPGVSNIGMGTKSTSTLEAATALKQQLVDLHKNPITEAELRRARDSILNAFIFNFDSKDKVLAERMRYEFYGYPADFLERYRTAIEKVTTADVNRVAAKYIHPEKFATLVVGNPAEFDKKLDTLGPVTKLDISIPPPPGQEGSQPAASAAKETTPEAKALMQKFVQWLGGETNVQAVKSVHVKLNGTQVTPQGEMPMKVEVHTVLPDRMHAEITSPMMPGTMSMVIGPEGSFLSMAGAGTQPMPPPLRDSTMSGMLREPIQVAQHLDDPNYVFAITGEEKVGDKTASVVAVRAGNSQFRYYLDPQTGELLRVVSTEAGMGPPKTVAEEYSDWRTVNGTKFSFKQVQTSGGKPEGTNVIESLEVNPQIDPKLFAKPAAQAAAAPQ